MYGSFFSGVEEFPALAGGQQGRQLLVLDLVVPDMPVVNLELTLARFFVFGDEVEGLADPE